MDGVPPHPIDRARRTTAALLPDEKRRVYRVPCAPPGEPQATLSVGAVPLPASLLDLSARGAGLEVTDAPAQVLAWRDAGTPTPDLTLRLAGPEGGWSMSLPANLRGVRATAGGLRLSLEFLVPDGAYGRIPPDARGLLNRRRSLRLPWDPFQPVAARLQLPSGDLPAGTLVDLSLDGACLALVGDHPVAPRQEAGVRLCLCLPGEDRPLHIDSEVLRVRHPGEPDAGGPMLGPHTLLGVRFRWTEAGPDLRASLADFLLALGGEAASR